MSDSTSLAGKVWCLIVGVGFWDTVDMWLVDEAALWLPVLASGLGFLLLFVVVTTLLIFFTGDGAGVEE